MIRLEKINRYFNRHKKNEIHVINNISLEFDGTGLVALLGPSGCGKTTLLNTIGGLDKLSKGKIYIDGKPLSHFSSKLDETRNINIGYIFQDYKLIENLSVYDNVAIVLNMIGIKNKTEIKKRVEYVLDKVGMLRYKKRPANMLSGGERQRVGIARAIVKDPKIILADEPTGNLDSKNSLEVMRIIKAISKEKLVILVTHEQDLAKFYASRIIEVQDGQVINDYKNESINELDYEIDNNFYLLDFKNNDNIEKENININVYRNNNEDIKLDIVLKNGNIYIKSNTTNKIEVVDNNNIHFINDKYKKIDKSDFDKLDFDFKNIIDESTKKKYSSIFNLITLITNGFKKVLDFPILKKLLLIGFFIAGMFITYSISSISSTLKIDDNKFVELNKNYLILKQNKINVNDYLSYENKELINYIMPGDSITTFNFTIEDYYQTSQYNFEFKGSLSDISLIDNVALGKLPSNNYEIVVDKKILTDLINDDETLKMSGIVDYKEFLNRKLSVENVGEFTIVGITDLKSPSIYVDKSMFIDILFNSKQEEKIINNYELFKDKIVLKKGRIPENDYEIIVPINEYEMELNKQIETKINDNKLTVVGYYDSMYNYDIYLTNLNTVKYELISTSKDLVIYSKDKEKTISDFKGLNIKDSYLNSKIEYQKSVKEANSNTILVCTIILLISFVEMYLMMRSSFLARIKEIGIYRAIGVKKMDIYRMFYGEIIAITTLTSVPGVILMTYILKQLSKIKYITDLFVVNSYTFISSIIIIYIFNLIVGLLPVMNVIRKTPAAILSRNDLE